MNAVVVLSPLAEDDLVEIWCTVAAEPASFTERAISRRCRCPDPVPAYSRPTRQFAQRSAVLLRAWNMRQEIRSADDPRQMARMYIQLYADDRLFSWDERKNKAILAERGFDFEFASLIVAGPRSEVHMKRQSKQDKPSRGRADLERLRRMPDSEVRDSSPPELSGLPHDFWDTAMLVEPVRKQAISLRVDEDVLTWFKECGPRYQSRMNAVLRSYMHSRLRGRARP